MKLQNRYDIQEPAFYWDIYNTTTVGRYLSRQENAFIRHCLTILPDPCRMIEIACGSGRLTRMLHDAGAHIVGMDLDNQALNVFQKRCADIPLIQADGLHVPFASNSFDSVLAIQCVGYFDYHQFLIESKRILRKDGLLIFSFVNNDNYKRVLQRMLLRPAFSFPAGDVNYHQIMQMLDEHGLKVENAVGYNWLPFSRNSNNRLVEPFAAVEHLLGMHNILAASPWILIAARKTALLFP